MTTKQANRDGLVRRVTSTGKVRWLAQVRRKGAKHQCKTFTRFEDARKWKRDMEVKVEQGVAGLDAESQKRTLAEAIKRYRREVCPQMKNPHDRYRHLDWWTERHGRLTLNQVTGPLLIEAQGELKSGTYMRGNSEFQRSAATTNRYLATISHVLSRAVKWGWLNESPVKRVDKLKEPRGRVPELTEDQRVRLLDACRESGNEILYPVVMVALATGARRGEIESLRRADVDLEHRTALVRNTKNSSDRTLHLNDSAAVLEPFVKVARLGSPLLFPGPRKSQRPHSTETAWKWACRRAGLTGFRFHDLRHVYASDMARNGLTTFMLADALGHKTLAMVKRYAHLANSDLGSAIADAFAEKKRKAAAAKPASLATA